MTRRLALVSAFLLATASPAIAQIHPTHPGMSPHDPAMHAGMDSATHALLHTLFMSSWHGTVTTPHSSGAGTMAITQDSTQQVRVSLTADQHPFAGAAKDFLLQGDTLQWTQDFAGTACKAMMVVSTSARFADTSALKGKMACGTEGDITFALTKQTK